MLQVRVEQQNAKARLDVQDPAMKLRTKDLQVKLSAQSATLEISSPAAELMIDSYPSTRSRGIKNNIDFDRDNAAKGMRALQEAIAKFASDGARLAKIENKGNPLKQLAKEAMDETPYSLSIGYVEEPTIRVTPHQAEVRVTRGNLKTDFDYGTVNAELKRGSTDLKMLQYPQVKFSFTDKRTVDIGA